VPEDLSLRALDLLERKVMQVTVEDLNPVKKKLHIEISEDDVIRELEKAYSNLRKRQK
jgi:FKBP-type peptidyl-prolyl cis-trans isomerase (trigger factor)